MNGSKRYIMSGVVRRQTASKNHHPISIDSGQRQDYTKRSSQVMSTDSRKNSRVNASATMN